MTRFGIFAAGLAAALALLVLGCQSPPSPATAPPPVAASAPVAVSPDVRPKPYALTDTEVRDLHSAVLGRDYPIYIALPPSYADQPDRRYPVLFVADAPYAFPLIRSIARRVR